MSICYKCSSFIFNTYPYERLFMNIKNILFIALFFGFATVATIKSTDDDIMSNATEEYMQKLEMAFQTELDENLNTSEEQVIYIDQNSKEYILFITELLPLLPNTLVKTKTLLNKQRDNFNIALTTNDLEDKIKIYATAFYISIAILSSCENFKAYKNLIKKYKHIKIILLNVIFCRKLCKILSPSAQKTIQRMLLDVNEIGLAIKIEVGNYYCQYYSAQNVKNFEIDSDDDSNNDSDDEDKTADDEE